LDLSQCHKSLSREKRTSVHHYKINGRMKAAKQKQGYTSLTNKIVNNVSVYTKQKTQRQGEYKLYHVY